jgi:ABC-type sulfate/molybdate transport systems ATPase subunit
MGPSGAGKSTVLDALSGLETLAAGHIRLGERILASQHEQIHLPPSRRGVGVLGQDALLFPHLTAAGNIAFAAHCAGVTRATARAQASDLLARVGLAGYEERRPSQLSGGERQRVALARALAAAPRLLLLDEPFASLDIEAAADMRELLREQLRGRDMCTVLVSHAAVDAVRIADRLLVIDQGRLAQEGEPLAVLQEPTSRFARAVAASYGMGETTGEGHRDGRT